MRQSLHVRTIPLWHPKSKQRRRRLVPRSPLPVPRLPPFKIGPSLSSEAALATKEGQTRPVPASPARSYESRLLAIASAIGSARYRFIPVPATLLIPGWTAHPPSRTAQNDARKTASDKGHFNLFLPWFSFFIVQQQTSNRRFRHSFPSALLPLSTIAGDFP